MLLRYRKLRKKLQTCTVGQILACVCLPQEVTPIKDIFFLLLRPEILPKTLQKAMGWAEELQPSSCVRCGNDLPILPPDPPVPLPKLFIQGALGTEKDVSNTEDEDGRGRERAPKP